MPVKRLWLAAANIAALVVTMPAAGQPVKVIAQNYIGASPSADLIFPPFVCPDWPTMTGLVDLYLDYLGQQSSIKIMGWNRLLNGPPMLEPDIGAYGCTRVAPGTPMMMHMEGVPGGEFPLVTVRMPDGKEITGVTFPGMYRQ